MDPSPHWSWKELSLFTEDELRETMKSSAPGSEYFDRAKAELEYRASRLTAPPPSPQRASMQLLRAIFEKTGGRSRAVRDVAELETGLTLEEARAAWRDLLSLSLIERFSQDYAARLSPKGLEFIRSAPPLPALRPMPDAPRPALSRKVFIVHGHETGARESVAEFVQQLDLHTIVLQEPADHGRTIMEQVETHGEVGFAIVLLTPEDLGLTSGSSQELRPRMEVLMELGYFMGRVGRARICALAVTSAAQLPSDLAGVVLESFDASGGWKAALRRELRSAGYDVDG